jgi:hypothetical protein
MLSAEAWSLRQRVLQHMGGTCVCPCGCGETNVRRLQIDHIHEDGAKERLSVRGIKFYGKLLSFPVEAIKEQGYQLLCAGCHLEKSYFGDCNGRSDTGDQRTESPASLTTQDSYEYLRPETWQEPVSSPASDAPDYTRRSFASRIASSFFWRS